ncbi:MAG: tyrosine recombinase XerC [Kineosporiaceae bacterium]
MGRPALPLGTMGEIRCYRLPTGKVRAVAYFRDYDGRTRQVERTGSSETAARNRLREAARERSRVTADGVITPEATVAAVAEVWWADVAAAVAAGEKSPTTGELYRYRLDRQVLPGLGGVRLRELSVSRVDGFLRAVAERHGPSTAKSTRAVLSGVLGLAVRHDALAVNLVRDASPVRRPAKHRDALTVEQLRDLRARLARDAVAVDRDLPDLVDMLIATGLRIGETTAITWPSLDLDAGTVEVRGTVIRVKGEGLVVKQQPKSRHGWRVVELPSWALDMLRRRQGRDDNPWSVVFPSPAGMLRDPKNTAGDLREAFDAAGYPGVTSHTFRRTVATLMDMAGLSARAAADQLGHAHVSMTTDVYFGRRVAATGARGVLEAVAADGPTRNDHHG